MRKNLMNRIAGVESQQAGCFVMPSHVSHGFWEIGARLNTY